MLRNCCKPQSLQPAPHRRPLPRPARLWRRRRRPPRPGPGRLPGARRQLHGAGRRQPARRRFQQVRGICVLLFAASDCYQQLLPSLGLGSKHTLTEQLAFLCQQGPGSRAAPLSGGAAARARGGAGAQWAAGGAVPPRGAVAPRDASLVSLWAEEGDTSGTLSQDVSVVGVTRCAASQQSPCTASNHFESSLDSVLSTSQDRCCADIRCTDILASILLTRADDEASPADADASLFELQLPAAALALLFGAAARSPRALEWLTSDPDRCAEPLLPTPVNSFLAPCTCISAWPASTVCCS